MVQTCRATSSVQGTEFHGRKSKPRRVAQLISKINPRSLGSCHKEGFLYTAISSWRHLDAFPRLCGYLESFRHRQAKTYWWQRIHVHSDALKSTFPPNIPTGNSFPAPRSSPWQFSAPSISTWTSNFRSGSTSHRAINLSAPCKPFGAGLLSVCQGAEKPTALPSANRSITRVTLQTAVVQLPPSPHKHGIFCFPKYQAHHR